MSNYSKNLNHAKFSLKMFPKCLGDVPSEQRLSTIDFFQSPGVGLPAKNYRQRLELFSVAPGSLLWNITTTTTTTTIYTKTIT